MDPQKLNLSNIPAPKRPLSEEEIGKSYIESMIALPILLKAVIESLTDISDSMSIMALYYEKKGLEDKLITPEDLSGDENEQ